MKKSFFILPLLLLFLGCEKEALPTTVEPSTEEPVENQDPEETSIYTVLNGSIGHWHESTLLSSDGNVIVVGNKRTGGHRQMLVTKTTPTGEVIFSTLCDLPNSRALGVHEDSQQHIYLAGYTTGENGEDRRRLAVAKLDQDGMVIWERVYQDEYEIYGTGITALNDNEIVVCGAEREKQNLILLKIDSLGEELQFKTVDTPDKYKVPSSILVLQDGNILITDYDNSVFNLSWFDPAFQLVIEQSYGQGNRVCRSAIQLADGSLVVVGKQTHTKAGSNKIDSSKVLIAKIDANGELLWEKEAGDTHYLNDGQSIAVNQDGSFVINGYALSEHTTKTDHMLIYVDPEGNEINATYFTDEKTFRGANIIKLENGRNVMTGGYQGGIYFLNVDNYGSK